MKNTLLFILGILLLVGGVMLALPVTRIIGGVVLLGSAMGLFIYLAFKNANSKGE